MTEPKIDIYSEAIASAVVRFMVEFLILFLVYFLLLGRNTNVESSVFFFSLFFILAIYSVPTQVQYEMMERQIYTPKMILEEKNIWLQTLVPTLIIGFLGAIMSVILVYFLEVPSWIKVIVYLLMLGSAIVMMTFIKVKNSLSIADNEAPSEMARESHKPRPFDDYLVLHHCAPWAIIVGLTALLVTYKFAQETLFATGSISVLKSAFSVGSTCYVIGFWLWFESHAQARTELKYLTMDALPKDSFSGSDSVFLIHCAAGLAFGITYAIGFVFYRDGYGIVPLYVISVITALAVGIGGNIFGVYSAVHENHRAEPTEIQSSD